MTFSRFISLPGRGALLHPLLLWLVCGGFCLCSCEDDMDRPSPSSHVSFTSGISSSWTPSTRSAADTDTLQGTVTALQGGDTPLYLHTLYSDSIASPFSDSCADTAMLTRATPIKNDNMYESFGVSAYSYTDSWSENKIPNYFYNATASKSGSGYNLSSTYYWPGASYKMKFFAYAPKDNGNYVLSASTQAGSPTISVTIPGNVDEQKDFLVAKTDELTGNTNTAVPLTFNHALTAIRFVCGNDMQGGTVKSVSLKNVLSGGTFNMKDNTWTLGTDKATFSQVLNKSTTGTTGEALTTDAQTFMMVPQTLPDGAQLEVVFTDNSSVDHTLTADIKGTVWPIGKTVTYNISSSSINWSYTFSVSRPADFTYTGGTQQYSVTSYRQSSQGGKDAVPWTAQFSTDGGYSWTYTRPDWLTTFTASGAGGETSQSYNATVSAQTGTKNNSHTTALRNASVRGSAVTPYNLANQTDGGTGDQNTANCYVVSAPGYYSFPLVYGNAIKNSTTNESAYKTSKTGAEILSNFINHTGNAITDPYISKNAGCIPAKAELVWQDARDLVTDIKYNNRGNGNISFKVNQNTIQQGNAVIAIKDDSGNVLWSWHIWVTDEDISNAIEVTNLQGHKYKLMSVNLGWCHDNTIDYAERSCLVRFTAGGKSQTITVKQASNSIRTGGDHPYYQFGRKDPFLPSNGLTDTNKTWYDKGGNAHTESPKWEDLSTGATCIKNYILKPDVMHGDDVYNYGDNTYANLWSADNSVYNVNDENVIKTIYDPSPVGFKLPASRNLVAELGDIDDRRVPFPSNGTDDEYFCIGWDLYTDSSKSKTIFFPASGTRRLSVWGNGEEYFSWTAVPYSRSEALDFVISVGFGINYVEFNRRGDGYGVRSSKDE